MSQDIIYDISDSDDEDKQWKVSDVSIDGILDPELMSYVDHIPSIKVEEDDIQDFVNRYNGIECDRIIKNEVLCDIYADPIPSSSHQNINRPKVSKDVYDNPTPGCSHHYVDTQDASVEKSIKYKHDLDVEVCSYSKNISDAVGKSSSPLDHGQVSKDVYDNPTPGCSHHYVDTQDASVEKSIKYKHDLDVEVCSYSKNISDAVGKSSSPLDHGQILKERPIINGYEISSQSTLDIDAVGKQNSSSFHDQVSKDVYDNPTPGCSHHYVDTQDASVEKCIKYEHDLDVEVCSYSKNISDAVGKSSSPLDHGQILKERPIINGYKISSQSTLDIDAVGKQNSSSFHDQILNDRHVKNGPDLNMEIFSVPTLDSDAVGNPSSSSDLEQMQPSIKLSVMQRNDVNDNTLNNSVPKNEIESSVYKESLQSLSLLYQQINGFHNTGIDLDQECYFKFCSKIAKIKSNHKLLLSEVECGNLIKFEQLVIWGRNLKRNAEDLIKEAKPQGSYLEEAQKFVLKMMRTEIRYRQRIADNNKRYMFGDTEQYKFNCIACDRRDNNLTWLVAHLCRDTAEIIYMCSFCGFLFFNNTCSLLYHVVLDLIKEPKKEYCIECEKFFPSVANHLMDMEGSWKVCCDTCDFISLSQCSLSIHQRFHKLEKYHACPECGAYFVFFHSLEEHLKNVCYFNFKKIRHICPVCAIIFKDKDTLYRHLLGYHHQRWIKCIQCPTLLSNRFQYIKHRAQNHPESPCTYQMCHTCSLCPGQHFKITAAQLHMKHHADDAKNIIVLYVCDCNYFTIHKHNFIEHKAQNCEASPTFGKWVNNHAMRVCGTCNDVKFANLSKPFVCENCEVLNTSESRISSLIQTYECKVCGLFLIYNWEAVIEHFFTNHPSISVSKYHIYLRSTYISRSCDKTLSTQQSSNVRIQTDSIQLCGLPIKMQKIDSNSSAIVNSNIANTQPIRRKKIPKKKGLANDASYYDSLSHFMAPNLPSMSNQVKMKIQKNNVNIHTNPSPSPCGNDVSITRLEQSVSILDRTVPVDNYLQANSKNAIQDSLSVDSKNSSMLCAFSVEVEKNEPINSSGNFLSGKKSIIEKIIKPNRSSIKSSVSSICTQIKSLESSDKAAFKGNVIYIEKKINPNHSDKTENQIESKSTISSTDDFIKMEPEMDITTKKSSLECKKCQFKCNETIELVKHFSDAHFIQNTYQCMECGECFANLKNKLNHLRSTHKIDTKCYLEPDVNRLDSCKSEFRCPVCLRGFLCNQEKNLHMRCHGMAYLQSIKMSAKEM